MSNENVPTWKVLVYFMPAIGAAIFGYNALQERMEDRHARERAQESGLVQVVEREEPVFSFPVQVQEQETSQEVNVQAKPQEAVRCSCSEAPGQTTQRSYKTSDFSKDSDRILMARIVFGEARNCSDEEMTAVAYTIPTRASDGLSYNGEGSIRNVMLHPHAYSCLSNAEFNRGNFEALKDPEKYDKENFERALRITDGVLSGELKNPALNANLYDLRGCKPSWLKSKKVSQVETPSSFKHGFYKEAKE